VAEEGKVMITNAQSGTNVHEIADRIFRINTPVVLPGDRRFSFNQYLVVDEEPMLFHTGLRKLFPLVSDAIGRVISLDRMRYFALSHVEADECGAMNDFLAVAPNAVPLCGRIAAMVSMTDLADRQPRAMSDGELICLGNHTLKWFDTPHMPHGWECGLMFDTTTRTFLCGDLFTQPGKGEAPVIESDVLGPSEAFRKPMTTLHTLPTQPPSWKGLPASSRLRWPACMAVLGVAMARRCSENWL
jgi:flavorubredoxin